MDTRSTHLPALDGLRAVAVFTVIVYHFGIAAVPGDLGVSAFFVLSGFLITWLLLHEHAANGTVSLRRFYTRRVLRIFPAYYAFLAVSFAIDSVRGQPWGSSLGLSSVFYLVNYYNAFNGHPVTSIAHAWSLGIEEQFYLLWPMLLLLYRRRLWSWLESPVVRYLGVISYPLYLWHPWGLGAGHHFHGAGAVGEFAAGILVCIALASASYFVVERPFLALKRRFEPAAAAARVTHAAPAVAA